MHKIAIITGASSGIGLRTAKQFVEKGVHTIFASRDIAKTQQACDQVKKETGKSNAEAMELDLADLSSVRKFAKDFKAKGLPLHLLVANAGVLCYTKRTTKEGYELTIGTNHIGHFLLTQLLLDDLIKSAPSRVIVVAARSHDPAAMGPGSGYKFEVEDMNWEHKPFLNWGVYRASKMANILFTYALSQRLTGTGVVVNAVCPGMLVPSTELGREMGRGAKFFDKKVLPLFGVTSSVDQAAHRVSEVALDDKYTESGKFYVDGVEKRSHEITYNTDIQKRLWELSEKWVNS